MKKYLLALGGSLAIATAGFAQSGSFNTGAPSDVLNVQPASPEAAKLGASGALPVNKYTGTVSFSIPFATLSAGSISIPVSLDYTSGGGIKPGEVANNAGLGWSLSGPGVISRTLYGGADEGAAGFLHTRMTGTIDDVLTAMQPDSSKPNGWVIAEEIAMGCLDYQQDVFSYTFGKYSGKFIFGWDSAEIINVGDKAIRIEYNTNGNPNAPTISEFIITGDDGLVYTFAQTENTQGSGTATCNNLSAPSAWYLTKIEDDNGNFIQLSYESYKYRVNHAGSEIKSVYGHPVSGCAIANPGAYAVHLEASTFQPRTYWMKRLRKIISSNGSNIEFFYNTVREDTEGLGDLQNFQSLDEVKLTFGATLVNSWKLTHDYSTQRLTLKKVEEMGNAANPAGIPTYSFDYDLPVSLSVSTKSIDHWGFQNFNNAETLVPAFYVQPTSAPPYLEPGANRDPGSGSLNGLLKKITYPTGGYTTLQYELNECSRVDDSTLLSMNIGNPIPYTQSEYAVGAAPGQPDDNEENHHEFTINGTTDVIATVSVGLFCGATSQQTGLGTAKAYLHKLQPGNTWEQVRQWQMSFAPLPPEDEEDEPGTVYAPGGSYSGTQQMYLSPGTYRVKAVAPDAHYNQPNNQYTSDFADIDISYTLMGDPIAEMPVGGARIKKIAQYDPYSQVESEKQYTYGFPGNDSLSSGVIYAIPKYVFSRKDYSIVEDAYSQNAEFPAQCLATTHKEIHAASNPVIIPQTSGSHIGYEYVTVSETGNGRQVAHFSTPASVEGEDFDNTYPFMPPTDYAYKTGLLLDEKTYDNNNVLLSSVENEYDFIERQMKIATLFKSNLSFPYGPGDGWTNEIPGTDGPGFAKNVFYLQHFFKYDSYFLNIGFPRVKKTVTQAYFPSSAVTTNTSLFEYSNQFRQYVVKSADKLSDGKWEVTTYAYPFNQSDPVATEMLAKYMLTSPLQVDKYKRTSAGDVLYPTDVHLSMQKSSYAVYGDAIRLEEAASSILDYPAETDFTVDKYDNKGNILCVTTKDDKTTIYLWGYNQGWPVAKIEHVNKDDFYDWWDLQISLQSTLNNPADDLDLLAAVHTVRLQFPNAMVNGFAYRPGVGMTCMSDANNFRVYYEYDSFNKLSKVRDVNGHILKTYTYKFQGPQ